MAEIYLRRTQLQDLTAIMKIIDDGGLQNEVSHLIGGKCKNAIRRDIRYHIK